MRGRRTGPIKRSCCDPGRTKQLIAASSGLGPLTALKVGNVGMQDA